MNIARTVCLIRNHNVGRNFARKFRFTASNYESSPTSQPKVQEEKFDFEDLKVLERVERRKAKISPFMKDVFVSEFNRDMLAYPEILNKEESEVLDQRLSALEKVFSDPVKTRNDRKNALHRTGMYGGPVSITHGGLAMNLTESLSYLEVISGDFQLGQQMSDHWVALETLKLGLESDQYQRIIGDLTSGDKTIALCLKEKIAERISQADFRTAAEMDGQGVWRISGEKVCYTPDGYYLVLCIVEGSRLRAFLVHPGAERVSHDGTFVSFKKTPGIPLNLVTEAALAKALGVSRLHAATLCRCSLTRAVNGCAQYVHKRAFNAKPLADLSTIKHTFGEAIVDIYASESAEYFTAGLLDGYLEPDAELEMAMCRNFIATHGMSNLLQLLAISSQEMPEESARLLDEMRHLALRGETLGSVNSFIALNGIHYAGKRMNEEIKQIRNPFFHPAFIMRKVFSNRHQENDDPKLTLHLAEHLHPTLKLPSEQLEYCVMRMRFACETLMSRHGMNIATAYTELNRLAESATEILVMTAVLARASRSYCIGLRHAEVEMKLASCFVDKTKDKVKRLILEIDNGEYLNLDHFKVNFGKKLLDSQEAIYERPTSRVFW